ncbi:hypothetical protein Ae201684_000724 [Aphanomyces euteiches]|uniref:NAD-dependent epimerase/dehydratase domain-containing protein n=1 Tax=Aphanomyces euteiches TaxID=100861 RepID=A0A6G0XWA6_9STRA|nr:hypothetical protein Ae201684_000724 [Aphanomyces euteiches]
MKIFVTGATGFVGSVVVSELIRAGVSAYVGDGSKRWSAVHRLDAAVLYRLVVEKATESGRVHAIAEESVAFRDIAEAIGSRLKVPVVSKTANEAKDHFGFLAQFVSMDRPVSSQWTRETFGWKRFSRVLSTTTTVKHTFLNASNEVTIRFSLNAPVGRPSHVVCLLLHIQHGAYGFVCKNLN